MFDHRCYEGIKIKVQDIALELAGKNTVTGPKTCLQQMKISG
jgi:hypothetical protein